MEEKTAVKTITFRNKRDMDIEGLRKELKEALEEITFDDDCKVQTEDLLQNVTAELDTKDLLLNPSFSKYKLLLLFFSWSKEEDLKHYMESPELSSPSLVRYILD